MSWSGARQQHDPRDDEAREDDEHDEDPEPSAAAASVTAEEGAGLVAAAVDPAPDHEADGEQHETAPSTASTHGET